MIEIAIQYLKDGYSVIPVDSLKQPCLREWGKYQIQGMSELEADRHFKNAFGIGMVMGGDKSLYTIDFDLKYSLSHDLYERIKNKVPLNLLEKMLVRQTKSGGAHWTFSCKDRKEGNLKLAQRHTTSDERHKVYMEYYDSIDTKDKALKIANNHKCLVLIETRGHGGYVVIPPTPGYTHIYGESIQEVSGDEYDQLMEIMRSFNEYKELKQKRGMEKYTNSSVNPFKVYDERGDVLNLLDSHGWGVVEEGRKFVRLKRPGAISSSSAVFDLESRIFTVFSTSTIFENGSYSPGTVYTILEAEGDASVAYRQLIEDGYGE